MRIGDFLYFAPNVRFSAVDLSSPSLGDLWGTRIRAYYLAPTFECIEAGHAFAAGLLLTATIDAMSRLQFRRGRVGRRPSGSEFKRFIVDSLPSFRDEQIAAKFYDEFRNGLTHEARIKNGGEFSFESQSTVYTESGLLRVNPSYLVQEVDAALTKFVAQATMDPTVRDELASPLREDFAAELAQ